MKVPLRYQISEYDCGPTSLLNAVSYLFDREEIPPELVRNIMLYCLDGFGPDGSAGKSGTSCTAMMFLSGWIDGFGQAGHLPVSSRYLRGASVHLREDGPLWSALRTGGAAVTRVDLEGEHYVLLTGLVDGRVRLFDPYYRDGPFEDLDVEVVRDHPYAWDRIVPIGRMERTDVTPYAFGPIEGREAVLLFNQRTRLTEDETVEYMI